MVGVISGCDAGTIQPEHQADPSDRAQVTAESFDQADLQYDPVSLEAGETFSIELIDDQIDRGVTRIVHEGAADGRHRLRAHFAPLNPSSVTVMCRNERTGMEQKMETLSGDDLSKGEDDSLARISRDPDSYHYIDNGDNTIVEVDYDKPSSKKSLSQDARPGAGFRFAEASQPVRCTHVSFVLDGVSTSLSADGIRFGGDVEAPTIRKKKLR
jgi:hypothetical protein